jgi:hypothetical protein
MEAGEAAWLEAVAERLGEASTSQVTDEELRLLLRVTKVAADATGVRYLAPLTSYLIGRADGRARATGGTFDLRRAVDGISGLAADWPRSPAPPEG